MLASVILSRNAMSACAPSLDAQSAEMHHHRMNSITKAKNARSAQLPRTSPAKRIAARKLVRSLAPLLKLPMLRALSYADAKAALFTAYERLRITTALEQSDGNVAAAAELLGMHRQSLQHILRKHGMPATNKGKRANARR